MPAGFFKFYWLVFREAWRHSLDIASIRYEVEDVYAEVNGDSFEGEPIWQNMGETILPNSKYNFDYQWIRFKSKKWIQPGTGGHVRIVFRYGIAGQPFTRRVTYAGPMTIEKSSIRIRPTENTEVAI